MSKSRPPKFPRWRVLVFPGATEIGLEIGRALASCKEVALYSAGQPGASPAHTLYRHHALVPRFGARGWKTALARVAREFDATHIFPAHDDVLLALAEARHQFPETIITSPVETCRITRDKSRTLKALAGLVPTPRVFDGPAHVQHYPVFVKPNRGQGSRYAEKAESPQHLAIACARARDPLIQEFLPGTEFTVDCFSHRHQGLLYVGPRIRSAIVNGISSSTEFVPTQLFKHYAERVAGRLTLHGAWFFQMKADSQGQLRLLEVAARIAGSSGLTRASGINLPLLSLYESEGLPLTIPKTPVEGVMLRTLAPAFLPRLDVDHIYVDWDDTLVVHGQLNTRLVAFLYSCVNKGIPISLLTRHASPIQPALDHFRIASLFQEIHQLSTGAQKSAFINAQRPLLIDDSFAELDEARQAVAEILTLHPSAIDLYAEPYA